MKGFMLFFSLVWVFSGFNNLPAEQGKKNVAHQNRQTKLQAVSPFIIFMENKPKQFINFSISKYQTVHFALNRQRLFYVDFKKDSEDNPEIEKWLLRDWSARLSFNRQLKPIYKNLMPYIGIGAGNCYIQDSKLNIKRGKKYPEETFLDYEMRGYFKHPGVFGAAGLQFRPTSKAFFFIQSKCSILFDQNNFLMQPSTKFTDLINISTGFRFAIF